MTLPAEVANWTLRETAHLNGGSAWFGYEHTCVQHPRLVRHTRCDKKLRTCSHTWSVDGVMQDSLEAAVIALGVGQ